VPSIQNYRIDLKLMACGAWPSWLSFHFMPALGAVVAMLGWMSFLCFGLPDHFSDMGKVWKTLVQICSFWERRARRIIPAMVLITIVTLVAGWFVLLPADLKNLGQASAAQAVFGAKHSLLARHWLLFGDTRTEAVDPRVVTSDRGAVLSNYPNLAVGEFSHVDATQPKSHPFDSRRGIHF